MNPAGNDWYLPANTRNRLISNRLQLNGQTEGIRLINTREAEVDIKQH